MPKVPKTSLQYLNNILRKTLRMNLIFCLQINVKGSSNVNSNSSNCYYHFRCVWPCMQIFPKIISLLFLCNILKNWLMKLIFGVQINIEVFYTLILSFWVCTTRHAQSNKSKKFAYLCNISRKVWWVKLIFCLQNSITLGLRSQAWLKHPKQ